ncbi:MAG: hypothetical protein QOG43_2590 [Actinomycetota bacterium]|nr:hypothetical protein [Actinomycetota bacterium]
MAEADKPRDNRETARIVGLAVTVIVLLALLLDNGQSVRIGYVVGDVRAPLIGVLAITAVLGALVDRLLVWRTGRAKHNG